VLYYDLNGTGRRRVLDEQGSMDMVVPNEVSKLIRDSGNNFHAKVARWLSENDWHVIVSHYYMDQTQNKARELDLIAEKAWPGNDMYGNPVGNVAVRLFIECKYVHSHSVFWFSQKDQESALKLACTRSPFLAESIYTKEHHYLAQSSKVAKLFATSASKAPENDPFYKALNQALNAMVSMRGQPVSIPALNKSNRAPRVVGEFPVVVCSSFDKLYAVDFYTDSQPKLIKDNFQLEVRYAYIDQSHHQREDYFLLDIIEFSQLEKFAAAIAEDAKLAAAFVSPS
jgi:hypothetical protein